MSIEYAIATGAAGVVFDTLGLYWFGKRLNCKSIETSESLANPKALGHSYLMRGNHAHSVGNLRIAVESLSKALDHFTELGDLRHWDGYGIKAVCP